MTSQTNTHTNAAKEPTKLLLVHVFSYSVEADPDFIDLVRATGGNVVECLEVKSRSFCAKHLISKGHLQTVKEAQQHQCADLVVFSHALTPAQERNLTNELCCRVIDRTALVLDIFAQRAQSFEGKLQVELAQLRHLSTRLVRGWTHLERQKGGIGLRGPGETQLEIDRRLIVQRIKQINRRLKKVRAQREISGRRRQRRAVPTVALVGYTNAGKSTLFNALTQADIFTADQMFATLDATIRRVHVAAETHIVLADTVGFIRDLPAPLLAAFHATLSTLQTADLLLHVVDVNHEDPKTLCAQVNATLASVGAAKIPQMIVYNKIDQHRVSEARVEPGRDGHPWRVWLSAQDRGVRGFLVQVLADYFAQATHTEQVTHT